MFRRILLAVVVLAPVPIAHAAAEFMIKPPDQPIFSPLGREPAYVKEIAASHGRVFATEIWWTGGYAYRSVYFQGDTQALNRLLQLYAQYSDLLSEKDGTNIILSENLNKTRANLRQQFLPPRTRPKQKDEPIPAFDWCIHINSHIQIGGPKSGKLVQISMYIEIWPGQGVSIDDLKVPRVLRVKSIGERFERFADIHETRRLGSHAVMLVEKTRAIQRDRELAHQRVLTSRPAASAASR